jgi:hypothetical protein
MKQTINEKKYYSKIQVILFLSNWNSDPPGKNLKYNSPYLISYSKTNL